MTTDFARRLKNLSVLQLPFGSEKLALATQRNSQLFVASQNVVKVLQILEQHNVYKILDTEGPQFEIKLLQLNKSESSLAAVGDRHVNIVDLKQWPSSESNSSLWKCFSICIGPLDGNIKSVAWHPASLKNSEIVILTDKQQILLYDVVISFSKPMLTVDLKETLKGREVISMCFGSDHNFAGSLTLYISTKDGAVFAVYPFLYKDAKIRTTKLLVTQFIAETTEMMETVKSQFPPLAILQNDRVMSLLKQLHFAQHLESQVKSPLNTEKSPSDILHLSHNYTDIKVQGPVAQCAPNSTLQQLSSNEKMSLLCSFGQDSRSQTSMTYMAQFQPLIMGWTEPENDPEPPVKVLPKLPSSRKEAYARPAKGFGFVVMSESDDEEVEDNRNEEIKKYEELLSEYNQSESVKDFFNDNFNTLTVVASDETTIPYHADATFKNVESDKFLLCVPGYVLFGDCKLWASKLISGVEQIDFKTNYLSFQTAKSNPSCEYIRDTVQDTGSYVVVCSPQAVEVFQLEDKVQKFLKSLIPARPQKAQTAEAPEKEFSVDIMAFALKPVKDEPITSAPGTLSAESPESLKELLRISNTISNHTATLTKFMLSLQLKLQMQVEDLRQQTKELQTVRDTIEPRDKIFSNLERIEVSLDRQEKLTQRQKDLQKKVMAKFENAILHKHLPLSEAEQKWFKELNHINSQVTMDTTERNSLVKDVESLSEKVKQLSLSATELSSEEQLDLAFKRLLLGTELARINHFLMQEGKIISLAKSKLQLTMSMLDLKGSA